MPCSVPVLLLAFNRPIQTRRVIAQIRLAAPPRVYVHCDGPRANMPPDEQKVSAVRQLIRSELGQERMIELKELFRENNAGLREGVFDALNWFFGQEEYGIILEDDCVPDASMFRFCEELLFKYKDEPRIMHIGCSNLAEHCTARLPDSYVFSRFSFVWGWASWRRAWQKMSLNLADLDAFEQSREIKKLVANPMAQVYMLDKFKTTQNKGNNSWAYAWFYSILRNNGLCIVPKINLVHNQGIGEEGATNTTRQNKLATSRANVMKFPLIHPSVVSTNTKLEQQFFYTSQKRRYRLILWYLLHLAGLR